MTGNTSFFIAQRIFSVRNSAFSTLISRIAIGSVAIGVCVGLLAFMIFNGFRQTIENKIFSFAAHLQITKFTLNNSHEDQPISTNRNFFSSPDSIDRNIASVQIFGKKPALMRANDEALGVVLKGISHDFDRKRFETNITSGKLLAPAQKQDSVASLQITISQDIANKLNLKVEDKVLLYFIQDPPKFRKMTISGIYKTDIEDFDKRFVLADHRLIQEVNGWEDSLAGGYELLVKDFADLDSTAERVYEKMDYDVQLAKVTDQYIHFFDWFVILNRNVIIFLSVILFVACFNTMSILLILIMERTSMIGMLKALGASQKQIQAIFLYNGLQILWKGLLVGNILALSLAWVQDTFKLFTLDAVTYYMDTVPIAWDLGLILWLNLAVICLVCLVLFIPVQIILRISSMKAIRFD